MKSLANYRLLTAPVVTLVAVMMLFGGMSQSARAEISALGARAQAFDTSQLEQAYKDHSMLRNKIAAQLKWLWREERFLKEDYERSGDEGDYATNAEVSRDLLRVRQQIDGLRAELSRENQNIQSIGDQIPD